MARTVLLEHRTPDGGSHFDWLLAPDDGRYGPDDRVLISFRVSRRIDLEDRPSEFEALRIGDHRWVYLSYEGDLSEDRGSVQRLAEGVWTPEGDERGAISGSAVWEGRIEWRFEGRQIGDDRWVFQNCPPLRR